MAITKILGYGTKLMLGDGAVSGETFTLIPGVKSFKLPTGKADLVDVTTHDSPGKRQENITGLLKAGSFTIDVEWDQTNVIHAGLWELYESGAQNNFQVVLPDAGETTFDFAALLTQMEWDLSVDKDLVCTCTLDMTGDVTLVP